MRLFICKTIEEYNEMLQFLVSLDQPIYIYSSDDKTNIYLIDEIEVDDPNEEIERLLIEREKDSKIEQDETLEEILFDYSEESEDDIMLFL